MKLLITIFLICSTIISNAQVSEWIIVSITYSTQQTVEVLRKVIQQKGFKIFNTIDHAQGAESVGLTLRPTMLIIFGNPKGGSPLMNCDQRMRIILPMKILIWEDESKVKAGFINPEKYAREFDFEKCKEILPKMATALKEILAGVEKK